MSVITHCMHAWKIWLWLGSNNVVAMIVIMNAQILQISQKVEYIHPHKRFYNNTVLAIYNKIKY